jgi:hypothetical protein
LPDQSARERPPTQPEAWADRDADLATQVRLPGTPGAPFRGRTPCRCGGTWRYRLASPDRVPIARCLHCGRVMLNRTEPSEDAAGSGKGAGAD